MLDTRSGRLLASREFKATISEVQFSTSGISYFHHSYNQNREEEIELHQFNLDTQVDTLVTRYVYHSRHHERPSRWRGSLSSDGSLMAYHADILKPSITIADGSSGTLLSTIRWEPGYSALPVYFHPQNKVVVIPLAQWDAHYNYSNHRQLIVAEPKTGKIISQHDVTITINDIRFQGDMLVLYSSGGQSVGHLALGAKEIQWKAPKVIDSQRSRILFMNSQVAGFTSTSPGQCSEFQLDAPDALPFTLEEGFSALGLHDKLLVSQKHQNMELKGWMTKLNEYTQKWWSAYLFPPVQTTIRYQDSYTGKMMAERTLEIHQSTFMDRLVACSSKLANMSVREKDLRIEFMEVFPFWTWKTMGLLACAFTMVIALLRRARRHRTGYERKLV